MNSNDHKGPRLAVDNTIDEEQRDAMLAERYRDAMVKVEDGLLGAACSAADFAAAVRTLG